MLRETLASVEAQDLLKEQVQVLISMSSFPYHEKIVDLARLAKGEYILPLCDDDTLRAPDALREFLAAADRIGADLVYSDVQEFGQRSARYCAPHFTLENLRRGPVAWFTSLIRRTRFIDAVEKAGNELAYSDWASRYELFKAGAVWACVRSPLWNYRAHAEQHMQRIDMPTERERFYQRYPELRMA
jgi:hypothetical protein